MFITSPPYREMRYRDTPRPCGDVLHLSYYKRMKYSRELAFRVLWSLAGTLEAGFFAFLHARVACEEAGSA